MDELNEKSIQERRILNIRSQIKQKLTIIYKAIDLINKHLTTLRETDKKENIPEKLRQTIEGSIKGLEFYKLTLNGFLTHFSRNKLVTNEMHKYSLLLDSMEEQLTLTENKIEKI